MNNIEGKILCKENINLCEHLNAQNIIYCVQEECKNKYKQVCESCIEEGQLHKGHKFMSKQQLVTKLHQDKEQLTKELNQAKNMNGIQEQVRERFEEMRNQITAKLDACASQIFQIISTKITQTFNMQIIDDLLERIASIKPPKQRNSLRQNQNVENDYINKDLIEIMRVIDMNNIDKIIYKDKEDYHSKHNSIFYQIDDLQNMLDNFIKQNLNKIIINIRENKLAFPLDEFSYSEKVLQMHKHHVNKLVQINNNYFASASSDQEIIVWSAQKDNKPICTIQCYQQITSLEVLDSNHLMCGGPDGNLCLWNWRKRKCVRIIFEAHELSVDSIKKIRGKYVATGGGDSFIRVWDISNGKLIKEINIHTEVVNSLDIIDKTKIICGSSDQNLTIWDSKKGNQIKELAGHLGQIKAVKVISQDIIASGGTDQLLKIWKWKEGVEYRNLSGHLSAIYAIEKLGFHEIASGSIDCTVKIWNWYRSQCLKTFTAHRQTVCSILRISNKQFVTASDDTTVKIWS